MSVTLGQLKAIFYGLIQEDNPASIPNPNTHFPDSTVVAGFLNQGAEFAAVFIEYPRDLVSVQAQSGIGSYPNPADNLLLRTAYFGDSSIVGDIKPITITTEETLKTIYPSWLDQTSSGTADRPQYLIQIDRNTVHIFPRPNAAGSATGKKLWLNYNYVPASMVNDSDVPDLPVPYHNLLPFYAVHLAAIPLKDAPLSIQMYNQFMQKVNLIKSAVTKESKDNLGFSWGNDVDVDSNSLGGINF